MMMKIGIGGATAALDIEKGLMMAKKPAAKAAKPAATRAPAKAKVEPKAAPARSESGMEAPAQTVPEKRAEVDAQFAAANVAGDPRYDEVAAGVAVRGF